MPRTFYTERDIEDLARRGVTELELNDSVYLTDLAREKMDALGIKRKVTGSTSSTNAATTSRPFERAGTAGLTADEKAQVIERVKSGVIARLGPGVDTAVVDAIVRRVVNQL